MLPIYSEVPRSNGGVGLEEHPYHIVVVFPISNFVLRRCAISANATAPNIRTRVSRERKRERERQMPLHVLKSCVYAYDAIVQTIQQKFNTEFMCWNVCVCVRV